VISLTTLTLDPGRHLAGLDVTGLLSLDPTGVDRDGTGYKEIQLATVPRMERDIKEARTYPSSEPASTQARATAKPYQEPT
jgi:hypothetical protein